MDELLPQFIVEARELAQEAIDDLLILDAEPSSPGRLDSAFRAVHTLKGSVGLFDLAALQAVLHRAEDSLGEVRAGAASLDATRIDSLIAVLEWVDACVDEIEAHGAVQPDTLNRANGLKSLLDSDAAVPQEPVVAAASASTPWALALQAKAGIGAAVAVRYQPNADCFFSGDDPIALVSAIPGLLHLSLAPRAAWPAPDQFDPFRSHLIFEALSSGPLAEIETIFRLVPDQVEIVPLGSSRSPVSTETPQPGFSGAEGVRSLRIEAARIDAMLDTVGELMTAKNRVAGLMTMAAPLAGSGELVRDMARLQKDLDRLVGALYGSVLQTRMIPLSSAFRRLPRMVRDLAARLGKPTDLQIEGDSLEVDKAIVDGLFEPLLHLVRNAMDHGIEPPDRRMATSKAAMAQLALRVVQQDDQVVITLTDDGRGIDPAAIRAAAVAKGLMDADDASRLDDAAALETLFLAGFSTAASVNDLSGRGVGLDVVRSDIVRLGGRVEIASRLGHGTTITLSLPASFAMTQLLVVTAGGERYGVPMASVVQTLRVERKAVTPIRDGQAFVFRDRAVPLVSLSALLGLHEAAPVSDDRTVMILALNEERLGLAVDSVAERVETITRPLGGLLSGLPGIAGTTVLGDGHVLLVLDVAGLIH